MTLTEFLLAEITKDEEVARAMLGSVVSPRLTPEQLPDEIRGYLGGTWGEQAARWDPTRVLAECAAKRAIVEDLSSESHVVVDDCWYTCGAATEKPDGGETCDDSRRGTCDCGRNARVTHVVRVLALPYADHSGYREEWRP